jgi:hypothetical protein
MLMLVLLNNVDGLVSKVKGCAVCIEIITNEFVDTLETVPIICCMPPPIGSSGFPMPCISEVTWKTGFMLKVPLASVERELARLRSNPMTIGADPTVIGAVKVTVAVMGPEIVFWTSDLEPGSIYIAVAELMLMDAPV